MAKIMTCEVVSRADEVLADLRRQVALGLEAIGQEAEGYAKDDCPVDTGRLRNSITHSTHDFAGVASYADNFGNTYSDGAAKGTPEEGTVYIGTNVEYAPYVEYGDYDHTTGKNHFLRDAATNHSDHYKAIMEAALKA